jgi:DMSO reductase family type II enzyme chaperone
LATANYVSACAETDWLALQDTGKPEDDLAAEYTRLFDRAARGECTLYGSAQLGPQMKIMEEVVRFYDHFGVTIADDAVETPDHLTVELEFIHCLAYGEAELNARGEDSSHYARARRDFIARHPGRLVSYVRRRLTDLKPMPYYAALFRLLDHCLQIDLERLTVRYGPASLEATGGCLT